MAERLQIVEGTQVREDRLVYLGLFQCAAGWRDFYFGMDSSGLYFYYEISRRERNGDSIHYLAEDRDPQDYAFGARLLRDYTKLRQQQWKG